MTSGGRTAVRLTGAMTATPHRPVPSSPGSAPDPNPSRRPGFLLTPEGDDPPSRVRVRVADRPEPALVPDLDALARVLELARADGADAAPALLERTPDALVLETGRPIRTGQGRHRAELGAVPAGEDRGRVLVRTALEDLVAAVHRQGWVIGLVGATGLGRRPDGTAVLADPSAMHPDVDPQARDADMAWVDAVAGDGDRTVLRRRVDTEREPQDRRGKDTGQDRASLPALVAAHRAAGRITRRSGRSRTGGRGSRRRRRPRERYLVGASLGLTLVILVGGGMAHVRGGDPQPGPEAAIRAELAEPVAVVEDVVVRRHQHLLDPDAPSAAVQGSPAEADDEAVRGAYDGVEVDGPDPEVREAEVVSGPDGDRATIRALVVEQDQTVIAADGTADRLPAEAPARVDLRLRYVAGTWLLEEVRPA